MLFLGALVDAQPAGVGLLLILLGYSLRKRGSDWANAVMSAGAALLVADYQDERKKNASVAAAPSSADTYGPWNWQASDAWRKKNGETRW
jgi:hypothetical protein